MGIFGQLMERQFEPMSKRLPQCRREVTVNVMTGLVIHQVQD